MLKAFTSFIKKAALVVTIATASVGINISVSQEAAQAQSVCNKNVYEYCLPSSADDSPARINPELNCTFLGNTTSISFGVWGCNKQTTLNQRNAVQIASTLNSQSCQVINDNPYFRQAICNSWSGEVNKITWNKTSYRVTSVPSNINFQTRRNIISKHTRVKRPTYKQAQFTRRTKKQRYYNSRSSGRKKRHVRHYRR